MKKLLVLAGGSERNRAWGEGCADAYRGWFDMTFFPQYNHWATGEKNLDYPAELQKIKETVEGAGREGEWYIIAKSIGSVLATKAIAEGIIIPKRCVFFGMPLNLVADSVFAGDFTPLSALTMPTVAYHNQQDPTANYEYATNTLATHAPTVTVHTLPGDTHDYLDFATYASDIKSFLGV
jgi:hypothetical protein